MTIYQSEKQYCVYITIINDVSLQLPTFYIGSTSVEKINNNYHGSVCSRKYKELWYKFIKEHPDKISSFIISYHTTREEATFEEKRLQILYNVVKSNAFVNMAFAAPNGFFGMSMIGRKLSEETKQKLRDINTGKVNGPHSEETKEKMSIAHKGVPKSEEHKKALSVAKTGSTHTEETKQRMSETRQGEGNGMFGKNHSEETRQKIGTSKIGKPSWNSGRTGCYSEETLKKMGAKNKGKIPWNKGISKHNKEQEQEKRK